MTKLRIGVMFEANQLSDIVGIDLLGNCSKEYVKVAVEEFNFPSQLLDEAVDMEFLFIATTLKPTTTTPEMSVVPTHTYETAPRDLDILVVGGPPLSHRPPESLTFLREASKKTKVIMTVCVGSLWVAESGILDGRKVTTNRFAIPLGKQKFPDVEWVDQRWVIDEGKPGEKATLWTAGGAGSGVDMLATYVQQNFHPQLAGAACSALDFDPTVRGQFYASETETKI